MAGTIAGGKAAAQTNKAKYGENFYEEIGRKGGSLSKTGGFYASTVCRNTNCEYDYLGENHLVRQCAGARGGQISKRRKKQ